MSTVAVPLDVIEQLRKAFGGLADGVAAISYLCQAIQPSEDEMANFQIAIQALTAATDVHVGAGFECLEKLSLQGSRSMSTTPSLQEA